MKKLLIGLLIALAVMVLLVVAMNACDQVPTAEAAVVQMRSDYGVVASNLLPYYNYSSIQPAPYSNVSQYENVEAGIYGSSYTLSSDGSITFYTGNNNALYFVIDIDDTNGSYYYLSTLKLRTE